MAAIDRREVSNAIRDRLAAQIGWITGVEVSERTLAAPCIIVDPLQGGTLSRMLDDAQTVQQGTLPYQLTCVGVAGDAGREQAEYLATAAIDALTGWTDGVVARVHVDGWGNVRPDHDVQPPVWISQPLVRATARSL